MPELFVYLIKVNVALLIFCAGYYAVLRRLTFYNLNRIYLITAIIFSTLYPLVNLIDFLNRHEEIAKPVQVIIINWQEPVKTIAKTFLGHDVWFWLQAAFWVGVIVFGIRLATQLLSLRRLHKLSTPIQLHRYMIRVIKGNINPFSFWRNIYINPDNHPAVELNAILEHEQIHVDEWHTLDILLGELSAMFYWFNPGIWLMKKAIRENIEFITDQKILQKGVDSKAYQYSLLNVNFGAGNHAIVNHFNISTIKKRIMMMNSQRSSKVNITRYLCLIPAVMCLLLIFSVSKAELNKAVKNSTHILVNIKKAITKINFIKDVVSLPSQKETEKLTAVSVSNISKDTITSGKLTKKITVSYDIAYDSAGKNGNKEILLTSRMDTNKKKVIDIRGFNDKKPEIFIDGVKSTAGLETLDPNDIFSIMVNKDDKTFPNGKISVITKAYNKTYDKDTVITIRRVGYPMTINKVRINGKDIDIQNGPAGIKTIRINGDTVKDLSKLNATTRHTLDSLLHRLQGYNLNSNDPVVVTGYRSLPTQIFNVRSAGAPISFANKLIIINGKEATTKELKKVSADKIDSITNLSGNAATNKYGDKAKNGVVVITTKK